MNPMDLFALQQQQLQLQQQLEMQNYAAMTMAAQQGMKEEEEGEEEEEEGDDEMQQGEYEGSYQYMDGSDPENGGLNDDYSSNSSSSFLLNQQQQMFNLVNAAHQIPHPKATGMSSKESFKKIKPVRRPGLVLKTPIAYQGNVDPSVIPIQREGMGRFTTQAHSFSSFRYFIVLIMIQLLLLNYFPNTLLSAISLALKLQNQLICPYLN